MKQLRVFWENLPTVKRLALVFITVSVLLGVLAITAIGSHITYAFLYTELEPRDAAAIVEKLDELKVPHTITANGTAIKVPREQLDEVRLKLAADGLPSGGGIGNEIFDTTRLGATEFEQQVNLRRALEGELSRSISTIDGIDSARVHLVLPRRRLFAGKSEGASASVILGSRGLERIGRREVAAIVHLVSTAVPQLSRERVSVVGADGTTLHRPDDSNGEGSGISDSRSDLRLEIERKLETRVRSMLERMTGTGAVEVRVNAELQSGSRERTEEHFSPTNTAVRSEHKTEELTDVENATVAGVPGAAANLPDVTPAVAPRQAGAGGNLVRRSHTRNWEVDRVVEKINLPAGDVTRLSVAVVIDGKYEKKEGQDVYTPRDSAELDELRAIVTTAVGLNLERGDSLELRSMRFVRPVPIEPEAPSPYQKVRKYAPYAAAVAGGLFVLALLSLTWRRRKKLSKRIEQQVAKKAEREEELRLAAAEARLLEEETETRTLELDPGLALQRRTEALEIATSDPATAAIVLRDWLNTQDAKEASEMEATDG